MAQATIATKLDLPQIQSTRFYDQFKVMGGNRNIDPNHVEKLKSSMLENPDWFKTKPAVINEAGYIIDGQHRLQAARQLNMPFYFVVGEKMNLGAARAMNIRQKQWTLMDYIHSYADGGNKYYKFALEMIQRYPALTPGLVVAILQGGINDSGRNSDVRNGLLFVEDERVAEAQIEVFSEIKKVTRRQMSVTFIGIYMKLIKRPDFNEDRFLKHLEAKPELLAMSSIAKEVYRAIEDVYNYNVSVANHLRLY